MLAGGVFSIINFLAELNFMLKVLTKSFKKQYINSLHATSLFLHPLKTSESQKFSVFKRRKKTSGMNWVNQHFQQLPLHKKMKFSIKEFFSTCDQIRRKLRIWSFTKESLNGTLHFLCSLLQNV